MEKIDIFYCVKCREPIKNNKFAIETLLKYGYDGSIDNIARLRLDILAKKYNLSKNYSINTTIEQNQLTLFSE